MSDYIIRSTDWNVPINIKAGTKNGDFLGSAAHDTDLLLFGRGTFDWGSGIEQNLLRLTENWASEAENPSAQAKDQYPKVYTEKTKGIKKPMVGQTWFNKSNSRLYVCTDNSTDPATWELDGEERFVKLSGSTMTGQLLLTRPAGNAVSLDIRAQDDSSDAGVDIYDNSQLKGRFYVMQDGPSLDTLRISKRVGPTVKNEIVIRDQYIETLGATGKIRTDHITSAGEDARTLTTKQYVDTEITNRAFGGGTISTDLTVERNGLTAIRAKSNDQSGDPRFALADSQGDKFILRLDQQAGGIDTTRLEKLNGAGGVISYIALHDGYTYISDAIYGDTITAFNINNTISGQPSIDRRLINVATAKEEFVATKSDSQVYGNVTAERFITTDRFENSTNGEYYGLTTPFNIDNTPAGRPSVARRLINVATAKEEFVRRDGDSTTSMRGSLFINKVSNPAVRLEGENPQFILNAVNETNASLFFDASGSARGRVAMLQNYPAAPEDTVVIDKRVGSTVTNRVAVRDGSVDFQSPIAMDADGASSIDIRFRSEVSGIDRANTILVDPVNHDISIAANQTSAPNNISSRLIIRPDKARFETEDVEIASDSGPALSLDNGNSTNDSALYFTKNGTRRGEVRYDDDQQEIDISVYNSSGIRTGYIEVEQQRVIANVPVATSATMSTSDDSNVLTPKAYVDTRSRAFVGRITQSNRNFRRNATSNGAWYTGDAFGAGSQISASDLDVTLNLSALNYENYQIRSSNGTQVFVNLTFSCSYILNYIGGTSNNYDHHPVVTQYNLTGGGLPDSGFQDFHFIYIPHSGNIKFQAARVTATKPLLLTPGQSVELRLDPDRFGPVHATSSSPTFQAYLDLFEEVSLNDIEWNYTTG